MDVDAAPGLIVDQAPAVSAAGHVVLTDALAGDLVMQKWTRWQDWTNVVLGVLLFITPFVFGATPIRAAAYTAYIGGVLLVTGLTLQRASRRRR